MLFFTPISDLIRKRYSCRTYQSRALSQQVISSLDGFIENCPDPPFGSQIRYKIVAALQEDSKVLKGLGTYGFIKNPTGFIIGAIQEKPGALVDFGYQMEIIILRATELNIGSCWLGGTFTKSRFAQYMKLANEEYIPSVIAIGYPADHQASIDRITRVYAKADRRYPWRDLFFEESFSSPLLPERADPYQEPLELLRLAPSASNKQPWRILKQGSNWHFYLQRTKKYPPPFYDFLLHLADLQLIDLGIAMAHFELSAQELNLTGKWSHQDPGIPLPDSQTQHISSWLG